MTVLPSDLRPDDVATFAAICEKYSVTEEAIMRLTMVLMVGGYGRTPQTAALLRAVADLAESSVETHESYVARTSGQMQ